MECFTKNYSKNNEIIGIVYKIGYTIGSDCAVNAKLHSKKTSLQV